MSARDDVELRNYLSVVRRRKGTIVFAMFIVASAALAASLAQTPRYESSASVLIAAQPSTSNSAQQTPTGRVDATRALANEIQFATSDSVRRAVREATGGAGTSAVSASSTADLLEFSARHRVPAVAAEIANLHARTYIDLRRQATVQEFLEYGAVVQERIDELRAEREWLIGPIGDLERALAEIPPEGDSPRSEAGTERAQLESQIAVETDRIAGRRASLDSQLASLEATAGELELGPQLSAGGASIVREARPSQTPVVPTTVRNVLLGLGVGLAFGLGLAFLIEQLDDSIRTREDLEAAVGVPAVGLVPRVANWSNRKEARLVAASEQQSPAAEAYRSLRTSVQFLGIDRPIRTLMITSPKGSEGKTTTTVNLAVTFALSGLRVAVVDCDLRRPRVSKFFHLPNEPGLTNALAEGVPIEEVMQLVNPDVDRLSLVAAGPPPPNPADVLTSSRLQEALSELAGQFDLLLIDSPPVLPVTDALILSAYVDAVLLLATANRSGKRDVALAADLLRQVDAPLVGAVLNGTGLEGAYRAGYGYAYQATPEKTTRLGRRRSRSKAKARDKDAAPPLVQDSEEVVAARSSPGR
jgi:polysaccharide biosynthesis transport protein